MKYFKTTVYLDSEALNTLKETETLLYAMSRELNDISEKDSDCQILNDLCSSAWANLSDFLDTYHEFEKGTI